VVPKAWFQIFIETVTIRYILSSRLPKKSIKATFMNSQVGLLSSGILAISAVLAGGLKQASGSGTGIIQSIGRVFGTLIRAAVSALSEKHLAEVKRSLVNTATDRLVPLIAGAFYYQHNASGRSMAGALGRSVVLRVGDSQAKTCGGPFRTHLQIPNESFLEDHATWVKPRRSTLSEIHALGFPDLSALGDRALIDLEYAVRLMRGWLR
jgi:hypothetical protein